MIDEYLKAMRDGGYSEETLLLTAAWLERFQRFFAPRSLLVLKVRDLQDWHQSLSWVPGPRGKLYAANTIDQAVGAVRRFYRWALAEGLISSVPTATLRTPRRPSAKHWQPTTAEARKLLAMTSNAMATGIRDRALLGLLFETGIPVAVCSRLDLGHLQLDTGTLLAAGRLREIHSLSDGLLDDLERYLHHGRPLLCRRPSEALFLGLRGDRLTAEAARVRLADYRKRL
jgi:integrase/recombinase XerD